MQEYSKNHSLREIRKLINILDTWGNVLVPTLPGDKETNALDRLTFFLNYLKTEFKIESLDDLQKEIDALNDKGS